MGDELKDGDELLLKGPAGALFRVKIGPAFTATDVAARLRTGEWSYPGQAPAPQAPEDDGQGAQSEPDALQGPAGVPEPDEPADPHRPGVNDPKTAWITYVAGLKHMSLEDASSYTKADLIEMAG